MADCLRLHKMGLCAKLVLALLVLNCASRQIKNDLELEEAAKRAAANDDSGWASLEKTIRTTEGEPDIEMQRKALQEVGKIQSPRSEILLKETLTNRHLRGESAAGLSAQRNAANKTEIDATIVDAATKNAQQFGGLTREEIKALGESDNPEAVRLLKEQMGRDPNKDELTIDSLGKILKRRRQSWLPQTIGIMGAATLSFDDEPAKPKAAEKPAEKPAAAASESPAVTAVADTPATDENDPEKVLLDYLAGDGATDTKDRAVSGIMAAHPPGVDYLLRLAAQHRVPLKARVALLDFLTRYAVNNQAKDMIDRFYDLRRRSARDGAFVASIDLSLRMLGNAFGRAVASGSTRVYRTVAPGTYERLEKETDIITLTQRPYPAYSAADVKTNLKKALGYYRMDTKLADRMQSRVNDLLNLPENKQSSERNLIFTALGRLYPDRDFYVLKKQGQDAFAKPGYFTTTLRLVTASVRGRSWQIAALQRLWGLTYREADMLRQIYLRDGKLLQQRMRL